MVNTIAYPADSYPSYQYEVSRYKKSGMHMLFNPTGFRELTGWPAKDH